MALPNPSMVFTPFDILPASDLNNVVENVEALSAGTGLADNAITTTKIANGNVTGAKIATTSGNGALFSKMVATTRNLTAASGDVAYTGVGFIPSSIIVFYAIANSAMFGMGMTDSAKNNSMISQYYSGVTAADAAVFIESSPSSGTEQTAIVKSFDADGFTLTWTKAGAPTGTLLLKFLCFR